MGIPSTADDSHFESHKPLARHFSLTILEVKIKFNSLSDSIYSERAICALSLLKTLDFVIQFEKYFKSLKLRIR